MTRFRAYKLDTIGDSFSYFDGKHFTLIEARYNKSNRPNILRELEICGKSNIDTLHITSWDVDHCSFRELNLLLVELKPRKIEFPGYKPHTGQGEDCRKAILDFNIADIQSPTPLTPLTSRPLHVEVQKIMVTPKYIDDLSRATEMTRRNIFYWPKVLDDTTPNDCSTVKLFRTGDFNVLSTGDIEKPEIANRFSRQNIFANEIDVLILAHHGAANGFTSSSLLDSIKPKVAVCCADFDNKFQHPKEEIRNLLIKKRIKLCTTKRGDVIILTKGGIVEVHDMMNDNTELFKSFEFRPKKKRIEEMPAYAQKDYYRKNPKRPY